MMAPTVGKEIPALGSWTSVGVGVGGGVGVVVGPGSGVAVGPGVVVGVEVGVILGVPVGVGVEVPVGVGVPVGPPTVKVNRQFCAGSRAGAGLGAVGATGSLPIC